MLRKHRQVLILLIGLLYVYSVCPLLCAAFAQKFCHGAPQEGAEVRAICCQNTQTGTAGDTETPSESGKTCCATDLELVLPDSRDTLPECREWIGQSLVSMLPISATLPVALQESLNKISPTLLNPTLFPDHPLTRRGPPSLPC